MAADNQVTDTTQSTDGPDGKNGVGALLRRTREERGIALAAAAADLRIRSGYLEAIESGRYTDLPGQAYAIGFVRGYAEVLGLDGGEIVRRFKQEYGAFSERPELVFPSVVSESSVPGGWLLLLAVIGAAVAYGAWYVYQSRSASVAEAVPALPDRLASLIHQPVGSSSELVAVPRQETAKSGVPASVPEATPAPEAAAAPVPPAQPEASPAPVATSVPAAVPHEDVVPPAEDEVQSLPVETTVPAGAKIAPKAASEGAKAAPVPPTVVSPSVAGDEKMAAVETIRPSSAEKTAPVADESAPGATSRVQLRADQDCWVEIRDPQGHVIYSHLLRKGDSYWVPARSGLVMTAGNAGAMTVVVDGKPMPPLGRMGMVRRDIALDPDILTAAPGE